MNISKFTHYDYKESGRNIDQLFKFYRCISLDLPQTVHSEWSKTIPGIGSLEWVWYSLPPASVICRKVMFSVVSISVHGRVIPMRFRPFQTCSLKNTSPPPGQQKSWPYPHTPLTCSNLFTWGLLMHPLPRLIAKRAVGLRLEGLLVYSWITVCLLSFVSNWIDRVIP